VTDPPNWPFPAWEGLPIILTYHGAQRADALGLNIHDIAAILEGGEDCEEDPRKRGGRERCARWRGQTLRVIVSREPSGWVNGEDAWIVINVKPV